MQVAEFLQCQAKARVNGSFQPRHQGAQVYAYRKLPQHLKLISGTQRPVFRIPSWNLLFTVSDDSRC